MHIYIPFIVLPVVTNFITCESTTKHPKEVHLTSTLKSSAKESATSNPLGVSPKLSQLYHTTSNEPRKGKELADFDHYRISIAPSHLTKLAKTLFLGFDPSFSKDYFEPFERRPRPVTLVAFRKNGLQPRLALKQNDKVKPIDVAELQSPYNDVGTFWQDEPGKPLTIV